MYHEFLKPEDSIIGERYVFKLNHLTENNQTEKNLYWTRALTLQVSVQLQNQKCNVNC